MADKQAAGLPSWVLPVAGVGVVVLLVLNRSSSGLAGQVAPQDPLQQQAKQLQLKAAQDQFNYQQGLQQLDIAQKQLQLNLQTGAVNQYLAAPYKCPKGKFAKDQNGTLYCRVSAGGTGFFNSVNNLLNGIIGTAGKVNQAGSIFGFSLPKIGGGGSSSTGGFTPGTI